MIIKKLPNKLKKYFWSYNTKEINLDKHKILIVSQILNWGNLDAIKWLFRTYDKKEIVAVANLIPTGQWDKKSLSFWKAILGIKPKNRTF